MDGEMFSPLLSPHRNCRPIKCQPSLHCAHEPSDGMICCSLGCVFEMDCGQQLQLKKGKTVLPGDDGPACTSLIGLISMSKYFRHMSESTT